MIWLEEKPRMHECGLVDVFLGFAVTKITWPLWPIKGQLGSLEFLLAGLVQLYDYKECLRFILRLKDATAVHNVVCACGVFAGSTGLKT